MNDDLDLLQGTWTVTALEIDGQETPPGLLASARVVIRGDRFTTTGMGPEYQGIMTVDSSARPRRFDMKFTAGPEKGNTNPGIYQLKGDTWKICLATRGAVRPVRFASPAGSGIAVETLTRGEAKAAPSGQSKGAVAAAAPAPATEIEGEWQLVSGVMDGKPMDASLVQWVKRVTQGNVTSVVAGPQVMMKAEFSLDPSKSPKAIDYVNIAGSNKGKSQQGIYGFEGDVLRICVAAPGAKRPQSFESLPKDGRALTVWKRA